MIPSIRRCAQYLALLLALVVTGASENSPRKSYVLFVGTYTEKESKGIYAYRFDPASAELTPLGLAAETTNPSFLAIDPSRRYLYAVNEVSQYKGANSGAVSAFAIDREPERESSSDRAHDHRRSGHPSGKLSLLNKVPTGGADPCYIAFDKTGKYVLVANYTGGSVAVFPVEADGRAGTASAFVQHSGSGVDPERQKGPHAHWIETTPDNRFAIAADLGLDELLFYRFDSKTGSLTAHSTPYTKLDSGAGPRHIAFNPNDRFAYSINELNSTVTQFSFDARNGELHKGKSVSTLPAAFRGSNSTAEIEVHPNGKFLFVSNRGADSIAAFAIDRKTGALTLVDYFPAQGKEPRNFEIDPTGRFLLVANQNSDAIVVFRIEPNTGRLTPTGKTVHVPAPVCLRFVPEE
jgi:6-phosphogluconolactonase